MRPASPRPRTHPGPSGGRDLGGVADISCLVCLVIALIHGAERSRLKAVRLPIGRDARPVGSARVEPQEAGVVK
jgi:hypothetical protein